MSRTIIRLLFVISILVLSGCKLAVFNVEGGEVQSIGSGTCIAGTICLVDVADTNFSETFTAVPDDGWYFLHWNSGDKFFCKNRNSRFCNPSLSGTDEEAAKKIIASTDTFYLMPIFRPLTGLAL